MLSVGRVRQNRIFPQGSGENLGIVVDRDRSPGKDRPYDAVDIECRLQRLFGRHCETFQKQFRIVSKSSRFFSSAPMDKWLSHHTYLRIQCGSAPPR